MENTIVTDFMKIFYEFKELKEENLAYNQELEEYYKIMDKTYLNYKDNKLNVDTFIKEHKHIRYCEAILYPDGTLAYVKPSHTETLIRATGLTHKEVYDLMPIDDSSLLWLLDYTGCISIYYNFYVLPRNKEITQEQILSLKKLFKSNIVGFNN